MDSALNQLISTLYTDHFPVQQLVQQERYDDYKQISVRTTNLEPKF